MRGVHGLRASVEGAEQWGIKAGTVIASAVFERDAWTYHICWQQIPKLLRVVRVLGGPGAHTTAEVV